MSSPLKNCTIAERFYFLIQFEIFFEIYLYHFYAVDLKGYLLKLPPSPLFLTGHGYQVPLSLDDNDLNPGMDEKALPI